MKEENLKNLTNMKINFLSLSQLMKLEEIGINIDRFIEDNEVYPLLEKPTSVFRDLLDTLNDEKMTKELKNKAFTHIMCESDDLSEVLNLKISNDAKMFLIDCIEINKGLGLDISPMFNDKLSLNILEDVWQDIKNGVDVKPFIESTLSNNKKELLRYALQKKVNIEDDLKKYTFIKTKEEVDELLSLRKHTDYQKVLNKCKDLEIAKYVCEQKDKGYDLTPFICSKSNLKTIKMLGEKQELGHNIKPFRNIHDLSEGEYEKMCELLKEGYKIEKIKNYSFETLSNIVEWTNLNKEGKYGYIDINTCLEKYHKCYYANALSLYVDCYKYKQTELIEDIDSNINSYEFMELIKGTKKLLKYNYETEKNHIDIASLFYDYKELKLVNLTIFDMYVEAITKYDIEQSFIDKTKEANLGPQSLKIVLNAYLDGYDINILLDKNLTVEHRQAIVTCMRIGMELVPPKEYNISESEKNRPENKEASGKKKWYTMSFDKYGYYEIDDFF